MTLKQQNDGSHVTILSNVNGYHTSDQKHLVESIQPEEKQIFTKTDLKELMELKENLQYKPNVLNLVGLYQVEIQNFLEFGVKTNPKSPAKNSLDEMLNFEKSVKKANIISMKLKDCSQQRMELEESETQYTKLRKEKERLLFARASVLSFEEMAAIEHEEGIMRTNQDVNGWEIERKKRIIENEKKLIEKRLVETKKHKNIRFYCKGELNYLKKWDHHFSHTTTNRKPKGLDQFMRYKLIPTNVFDLGAEEIHFRLCESQFHRFAHSHNSLFADVQITNVEYVVNPLTMKRFNSCKMELAKKHGFLIESMKPVLLFHGTTESNMENILKTNFLVDRIGSTTDLGYYGK